MANQGKAGWIGCVTLIVMFGMCTGLATCATYCAGAELAEEEARAARAAKKEEARQQEALQARREALRAEFDKAAAEIESHVVAFEDARAAKDVDAARAAHVTMTTSLAPYGMLASSSSPRLDGLRERAARGATWVSLLDAQKQIEDGEFEKALTQLKTVRASEPTIEGLEDTTTRAVLGVAERHYESGEEYRKQKQWIDAEAAYLKAGEVVALLGEEQRNKDAKRLLRRIDKGLSRSKKHADKVREKQAKELAYRTLCGEAPEPGPWDGGVLSVERYVKNSAHDPGSINVEKCTRAVLTSKQCWEIQCNVRGTNAFGAKILNRGTFWVASGRVVGAEM